MFVANLDCFCPDTPQLNLSVCTGMWHLACLSLSIPELLHITRQCLYERVHRMVAEMVLFPKLVSIEAMLMVRLSA